MTRGSGSAFHPGADDVRLLVTLGLLDGAAAFTLRLEDHRAAAALGGGLFLHCALDARRRRDLADLDRLHSNAPLVGGFVEFLADALVDHLPAGEGVVEFHVADHGPQRRLGQVRDRTLVIVDFEERALGVHDPDVDDGVGRDGGVVPRDGLLSGHVERLRSHVERVDPGDVRRDDVQPRLEQFAVLAEDGQRGSVVASTISTICQTVTTTRKSPIRPTSRSGSSSTDCVCSGPSTFSYIVWMRVSGRITLAHNSHGPWSHAVRSGADTDSDRRCRGRDLAKTDARSDPLRKSKVGPSRRYPQKCSGRFSWRTAGKSPFA